MRTAPAGTITQSHGNGAGAVGVSVAVDTASVPSVRGTSEGVSKTFEGSKLGTNAQSEAFNKRFRASTAVSGSLNC